MEMVRVQCGEEGKAFAELVDEVRANLWMCCGVSRTFGLAPFLRVRQ